MAPFFANQSCDPFTDASKPCTLGNYVTYSVNATSSEDVKAAVLFAEKSNIRFVVRNTGHEYVYIDLRFIVTWLTYFVVTMEDPPVREHYQYGPII